MSSDYYLRKWRDVLRQLQMTVDADVIYQETKVHEQKECAIVQRLSEILGGYTAVYNEAVECLHQNLQLQKAVDIHTVVQTISRRILELRHQLSKLQESNFQFITRGLVDMKLTTDQTEFKDIPDKIRRPPAIQAAIDNVWIKARELKEQIEEEERQRELEQNKKPGIIDFSEWDTEVEDENKSIKEEDNVDEETKLRRIMINRIVAQEQCRQVIKANIQKAQALKMWIKVLEGTNKPQARLELREKAAKMIQKYMRAFFEIKRKRIEDGRRDELLGLRICKVPNDEAKKKNEEIAERREKLLLKYEEERKAAFKRFRQHCFNRRCSAIKEDYRGEIRNWFKKWYKEVWFFIDIPKDNFGGSTLILKEEMPSPSEWKDMNDAYIIALNANKGKSPQQLKLEQAGANKEEMLAKKAEAENKKQEAILLQKMMKNPKMHPGFKYPESKETQKILNAVKQFHDNWDYLDDREKKDVKEKYIQEVEENNAWAVVKEQLRSDVDEHMREELKKLKTCLKADYDMFEEEWPKVTVPLVLPKLPKPKPIKTDIKDDVIQKMIDLAMKGFMKQYPKTKFEDFKGEPNFAGDDLRCNFREALPYGGETRNLWWDQCKRLPHGLEKILLVGPKTSGKTLLVHAMATVNDAILFELEVSPAVFTDMASQELQALVNAVSACAKAAQPAIVYIKYIHRLFYRKVPPQEPALNANILNQYLIKKLGKKFHKSDKVTIIGSCQDPWLLKSGPLLKQFPTVVLMPNTTYTTTALILREWVTNNRIVPRDFDVSCLAQVLQGYRFGYLKQVLQDFLTAERIIKIAGCGLQPQEVFEIVLADESETKVEYDKYLKWYTEKTRWGSQEKKHLEAQLEFAALVKKYEEKTKKRGGASAASSAASSVASFPRTGVEKVPPQEPALNANILNQYLIKKLGKKFHKSDKVTIIGSCQDPWLLKSGPLLKQFPTVVLMPNTTYTTTALILREWVTNNRIVPRDFDVSCLAQVLQGYRFGYLKQVLQDFLTAERIIKIAGCGLQPQEVFEIVLADESETKVEYDKYLKWYTEKTRWGSQEKKHLEAQLEFAALVKKYEEKTKKRGGASAASSAASSVASFPR